MEPQPLVSVVVVAYNSAGYILETLDSVKAQTYKNIELIVTDDASTDDTVARVEEWLSGNGFRFAGTKVVRRETNGGIAPNCNSGWQAATGGWVKLIGADDVLLENCVTDNMAYASLRPETAVVFSGMQQMNGQGELLDTYFFPARFFLMKQKEQLCAILHRNCLASPAAFFKREVLVQADGFNPNYPMMEDLPMWVKLLDNGYVFGGIETDTVRYRIHEGSVHGKKGKGKSKFLVASDTFDWDIRVPLAKSISPRIYWTVRVDIVVSQLVRKPLVLKTLYPLFWAWARFSPFTISRKPLTN